MVPFDPTQLDALDYELAQSWCQAGAELGIRVVGLFELPVGDRVFRYGALIPGFGTTAGLVLRADVGEFHPDQCGAIWSEATEAGYTAANLSPLLCSYDRAEFVQFLDLFGWFGRPEDRPAWHVGPTLPEDISASVHDRP